MRQECSLGPCLFTLLLNLKEELEKGGGIRLGRGNIGRQEGIRTGLRK